MIYYANRELSKKLSINLSRWKRWVREFLAPDPLGGLQSGYARQLSLKDAFTVYLGGFLVSELRFGVQEAESILADLSTWLRKKGYFRLHIQNGEAMGIVAAQTPLVLIHIFHTAGRGFSYVIRELASEVNPSPTDFDDPKHNQSLIGTDTVPQFKDGLFCCRTLAINVLYTDFLSKVMNL